MNLAIIPARGGSKRILQKNIRDFCGKPIIQYSIDAALESDLFDQVVVSTDDPNISEVAVRCGATAPFVRPANLSDDRTPTIPVIRHALQILASRQQPIDFACCIYATAPFICRDDLRRGFDRIQADSSIDFAFPVTTFAFPIFRSLRMDGDRVGLMYPENENTRSQDLPEAWHDVGQFYWGTADAWIGRDGIFSANSIGIPIPRFRVQDIDTEEDWARAELMFASLTE